MTNKRIALVIFNDPKIFPPTINAAAILAEKGYKVDLIGLKYTQGKDEITIPEGVNLIYWGELKKGIWFRLIFIWFCIKLVIRNIRARYTWIFAYNLTGFLPCFIATRINATKMLYHVHDDTFVKGRFKFLSLLKWFEKRFSKKMDMITYPQKERAQNFMKYADLLEMPKIVMNGPRLSWPKSVDFNKFGELNNRYSKIILYQGGLNWKRGIKNIILSLKYLNDDYGLVLIGKTDLYPRFKVDVMEFLKENILSDRVVLLPVLSYSELPSLTNICDIGMGVMVDEKENDSYNIKYLAGASNKLVEYMACGLPCVVPDSDSYKTYIEEKKLGICVSPSSPKDIADGIKSLLENLTLYKYFSANCHNYFKEHFNFDKQFEKVLQQL